MCDRMGWTIIFGICFRYRLEFNNRLFGEISYRNFLYFVASSLTINFKLGYTLWTFKMFLETFS